MYLDIKKMLKIDDCDDDKQDIDLSILNDKTSQDLLDLLGEIFVF